MTPAVKVLLITNAAVYLVQMISQLAHIPFSGIFGLSIVAVEKLYVFQIFTYMWLHGGLFHILFNMFALWMFGRELEEVWGKREFTKYYLVSGVGAGIFILLLEIFLGGSQPTLTMGASGAIFGILLASAMSWPNREVYLYFFIPVKMKYLVMGFGGIAVLGLLQGGGNISHAGHLGGLLAGFLYIQYRRSGLAHGVGKMFNLNTHGPGERKGKPRVKKKGNVVEPHDGWRDRSQHRREEQLRYKNEQERIDELLDRIAKKGWKSLSQKEKDFLQDVSKRKRGEH